MSLKYDLIHALFEALATSHVPGLIRRVSACKGVIFTLHRVLPEPPAEFSPNAILQVQPDFLDYAIQRVRKLGFDIVSLDEAIRRIQSDQPEKPFVVFTFDDAYRDNLQYALPILRQQDCPFTLYVPTGLVEGNGELWWQAIEDIIAGEDCIEIDGENQQPERFECRTLRQKRQAYDLLYWRMRKMPEDQRIPLIRHLAARYGYDLRAQCRDLIMTWPELRAFADERLCTIGAHTAHHYDLAKLTPEAVRTEIEESIRVLTAKFGLAPQHLAYPIGGRLSAGPREFAIAAELGLRSAVTTRPGGLYAENRHALTALPRISLSGLFQSRRYVDVFATGALFSRFPAGRNRSRLAST
ncbi:MAG TPA: polysaccharide deacetylase family protein [Devosiaceae bacterium]|nr:polysaccharide deacetylase family protein [Devosiaceae bacterium]